jgi:hypothetical protein
MPCEWCSARNLECVFTALSQKRGPKKKKRGADSDNEYEEEILTLDKREQVIYYNNINCLILNEINYIGFNLHL